MFTRVLDRMFGINPPGFFDQLKYKSTHHVIIGPKPADFSTYSGTQADNPYKFNFVGITSQIQTPGGSWALATVSSFPILAWLALFLIRLEPGGIVEPQHIQMQLN
jgi:hypothetical protein